MPIEGTGIQAGTTIASVTSSTIVMSATATTGGSQTVRVFLTGYGSGGDSNTVGVQNCSGAVLAGRDPTAARMANATGLNSFQGSASTTLGTGNLPPYTPSGSVSTTTVFNSAQQFYGGTALAGIASGGNYTSINTTAFIAPDTWGLASASSFSGSAQGGTSTPFTNVQPTLVNECVVAVLP
jgi:hypothetical protein